MEYRKIWIKAFTAFLFLIVWFSCPSQESQQTVTNDYTQLFTDGSADVYDLILTSEDFLVFRVRTCSDASISLIQKSDETLIGITEVILGGWGNSRSLIRQGLEDKTNYTVISSTNLLHCDEFRAFWISWRYDKLTVGTGDNYGENVIMNIDRKDYVFHRIHLIRFNSLLQNTALWRIPCGQAHHSVVETKPSKRGNIFQKFWKTVEDINNGYTTVQLRTNNVALIGFAKQLGQVIYAFRLTVGTTSKLAFCESDHFGSMKCAGDVTIELSVNDFEYHAYWIGWKNCQLSIGRGDIFTNNQLYAETSVYRRNCFDVNALGFDAMGEDSSTWRFNENNENVYSFIMNNLRNNNPNNIPYFTHWILTPRKYYLKFRAIACSDVELRLSPLSGDGGDRSDTIFISKSSADGSFSSGILNPAHGGIIYQQKTDNFFSCDDPRYIWLSWGFGTIELGRGGIIGLGRIFNFTLSNRIKFVNSVGFANNHEKGADYQITQSSGDRAVITTGIPSITMDTWLSVKQVFYFNFQVRVAKEAFLILATDYGRVNISQWEIHMGLSDSSWKLVKRNRDNSELVETTILDSSELSDEVFKQFYVSWFSSRIVLGRGYLFNQNKILSNTYSNAQPINAIKLFSNVRANWILQENNGGFASIHTTSTDTNKLKLFISTIQGWVYIRVDAEKSVSINLFNGSYLQYKIILSNSGTIIQELDHVGNPIKQTARRSTPGILEDARLNDFWINWDTNYIRVGKQRNIQRGIIAEYKPSTNVTFPLFIGHSSVKNGDLTMVQYLLDDYSSFVSEIDASSLLVSSRLTWIDVSTRNYLVFSVKACKKAIIIFSTVAFSIESRYTMKLILGADDDNTTELRSGDSTKLYKRAVNLVPPLSCDEARTFWLRWGHGTLNLGRGSSSSGPHIFSHQMLVSPSISALGFGSEHDDNKAVWKIDHQLDPTARDIVVPTSPTPTQNTSTLSEAQIALTVIGFLLVFVMFGGFLLLVIRPPNSVRRFLFESKINNAHEMRFSTASASSDS